MKDEYKKLGKNTAWMLIGNFASKLLSFFLVPLYTFCLSTDDYGIADLMTTSINLLSPLLTVAASEGILRFTLDDQNDKGKIFTISMSVSGIGLLVLLICSPLFRFTSFSNYYFLFLLYYTSNVLSLLVQQFVKGLNNIKDYAISGFLHTLVSVISNIILLLIFKKGVEGYLYAMIVGAAAPSVYLIVKLKLWDYFISPSKIDAILFKKYILYCLPLVVNQLSWWINNSSDKYILTYFKGVSANGIYSVSYKIPSLIATISTIFYSAWQISAVDDFGSEKSVQFFSTVYRKYVSLFVISSSGLILFIKVLAKLLFSGDFFYAWPYAVVLIIASIFQALNSFIGTIYTCALKTRAIFFTTLIGAIGNTILNFILIPFIGIYGAAIATLISYFLILVVRLYDSRKFLKIELNVKKDVINYSLLSAQAIVTCLQVEYWVVYSLVFFVTIFVINKEVLKDMINVVKDIFRRKLQ